MIVHHIHINTCLLTIIVSAARSLKFWDDLDSKWWLLLAENYVVMKAIMHIYLLLDSHHNNISSHHHKLSIIALSVLS